MIWDNYSRLFPHPFIPLISQEREMLKHYSEKADILKFEACHVNSCDGGTRKIETQPVII